MRLTNLQKWLLALALGIGLFGVFGSLWQSIWSFMFGEQAPVWRYIMSAAIDLEDWVRNRGGSPALLVLAFFIALGTLQIPTIWRWVRKHRINKEEFEEEFANNTNIRAGIRETVLYVCDGAEPSVNIRELLDSATIPEDLPLPHQADIYEWISKAKLSKPQKNC